MIQLLFFTFLFLHSTAKAVLPTWLTSNYLRAGNQPVIHQLTGNTSTPVYSFQFSSALPGVPNLGYGIKGYQGNDYLANQQFQIQRVSLTASQFTVQVQILGVTNLWILNVAYIAIDPNFPHKLVSFENVPINATSGPLVNISAKSSSPTSYTSAIDFSAQSGLTFSLPLENNKIILFITSLLIFGTFGTNGGPYNPIKLKIEYQILNITHYQLTANLEIKVYISRLHFSQIIFDQEDIRLSGNYQIVYTIWQTDKQGGFYYVPQAFVDNFILGLYDFSTMDAYCSIFYKWQFATNRGMYGVKLYKSYNQKTYGLENCSLDSMRSSMFYLKTWLCDPLYPIFSSSQNVCCDILVNGLCLLECGDKILNDNQECDDGNGISGDGCSSVCTIQQNWTCEVYYCCYLQPGIPVLSLKNYQKNVDKNQLSIHAFFEPQLEYINKNHQQLFSNASVSISLSKASITSISYDNETKLLNIIMSYYQNIQLPFTIYFNLSLPLAHQTCSSGFVSLDLVINKQPSNNLPLIYYSEQDYKNKKTMQNAVLSISIISWLFMLWGIFVGKIVGLELMGVLQLAFLNLADYDDINLMMTGFLDIGFVNGPNINSFSKIAPIQEALPSRVLEIDYYSSFFYNCNITIILHLMVAINGIITYLVISKFFQVTKIISLVKTIIKQMQLQLCLHV